MTTENTLEALAEAVTRLVNGWTDVVKTPAYDRGDRPGQPPHITGHVTHPGLVTQLHEALTDSTRSDEEATSRPVPDSRPPVPEPPFDVLLAIREFERGEGLLTSVVGKAAELPADVQAAITLEVIALARRAEIALGHAYAPRRIEGNCPHCGAKNTLRVNRDNDAYPTDAYCSAPDCDAYWDRPGLGLLARILEAG